MNGEFFDLSTVKFTDNPDIPDIIDLPKTIFNPTYSNVKTLAGNDQIIGISSMDSDFGFGVLVGVAVQNSNPSASVDLSSKATLYASGIHNKGSISTNRGRDVVKGTATVKIAAIAQTVSQAIAYADTLDTSAIAKTFASIDIKAIANGINNSGKIGTGQGSDTVAGKLEASVAAVATATADVTAIVQAIAQAHDVTEGLTAFAGAIAQSLAKATITARGINNKEGTIAAGGGADAISATATSKSATHAEASAYAFTAVTPDNKALALTVAEAIAEAKDRAIGIDNTKGYITLGPGADNIYAEAKASNIALAIHNNYGEINFGNGKDTCIALANGSKSWGIHGGVINMGAEEDMLKATSIGGNCHINMGMGADSVEIISFHGNARIDGGIGEDKIKLGSYNRSDLTIRKSGLKYFVCEIDGYSVHLNGFEHFHFADRSSYSHRNLV